MDITEFDFETKTGARAVHSASSQPSFSEPSRLVSLGSSSPVSSIQKSNQRDETESLRPKLTSPKHYMYDLLGMHQEVEEIVSKDVQALKKQSLADRDELSRLEQEKHALIRKYAEDVSTRNTWGVWGSVAQAIASGSSIVAGVALTATAPAAAAALITSGAITLGNRFLLDMGGWQKIADWWTKSAEDQKRIAQKLEMGAIYLSCGIGLAGGVSVLGTGALPLTAEFTKRMAAEKAAAALQCGSSIMRASLDLGQKFTEERIIRLQARLAQLEAQAERVRMEMSQQVADAKSLLETDQAIAKEIQKAINSSEIET